MKSWNIWQGQEFGTSCLPFSLLSLFPETPESMCLYKEFLTVNLCPAIKKIHSWKKKITVNSVLKEATNDSVIAQTLHKVSLRRVMGSLASVTWKTHIQRLKHAPSPPTVYQPHELRFSLVWVACTLVSSWSLSLHLLSCILTACHCLFPLWTFSSLKAGTLFYSPLYE